MCLRKEDQTDASIEAAVEGEVRLLGIDAVRGTVVRDDRQEFIAGNHRERTAEGRIAAVMMGEEFAIEIDVRRHSYALEFEIKLLIVLENDFPKLFLIEGAAAVIVVPAVGAVFGIPSVGEIERNEVAALLGILVEKPTFVDVLYFAHLMKFLSDMP
jgi:hypothetical protein